MSFYHEYPWNNQTQGYDRNQWVKRAQAFDNVIFKSCARRIILQKQFGYGYLVSSTINPVLKMFRIFLKKVIKAQNAKAYYICMTAFYKFLELIHYQIPDFNAYFDSKHNLLNLDNKVIITEIPNYGLNSKD